MQQSNKPQRKILVEFTFDWEGYEKVTDELMIEDAELLAGSPSGISMKVVKQEPVSAPSNKNQIDHVNYNSEEFKRALHETQKHFQSEGGLQWVKCSDRFPDDVFSVIIKDISVPFLHLIVEENVKSIEADFFLMQDGTRIYFEDAEWLDKRSPSTANTEEGVERNLTIKGLVESIFGSDAANDPVILSWYEDINKDALNELKKEQQIVFAEWIGAEGFHYDDGCWYRGVGYVDMIGGTSKLYELFLIDTEQQP